MSLPDGHTSWLGRPERVLETCSGKSSGWQRAAPVLTRAQPGSQPGREAFPGDKVPSPLHQSGTQQPHPLCQMPRTSSATGQYAPQPGTPPHVTNNLVPILYLQPPLIPSAGVTEPAKTPPCPDLGFYRPGEPLLPAAGAPGRMGCPKHLHSDPPLHPATCHHREANERGFFPGSIPRWAARTQDSAAADGADVTGNRRALLGPITQTYRLARDPAKFQTDHYFP